MASPTRYPLTWPEGWKRMPSYQRKRATFKSQGKSLTVFDGVQRVLDELERLGVHQDDVIVSTNLQTRLDGLPRSNQGRPGDPGVCVYWQKSAKEPMRCMAVDRYDEVQDNLAAVAATLEAMRSIERHGGAAILDRAFTGFAALPAPAAGQRDWWTVLGLEPDADVEAIRRAHRALAARVHPDRQGGSEALMAQINTARDAGLKKWGVA
ncbi:DnaJ domain-containing protein [Acidovorax sp. sif1233]|uniref:DnaJ domain-containing protein n=1 Tax=Acidovorax sp. sif1233 TaxID=2854792 RepID=UPI001C488C17|nr:DnaJ domain-containing protein [Acidovorax sp. sif1233]MBV7454331.1 DnaJ domain-containing protein [Acidovorax sp. sif1233]